MFGALQVDSFKSGSPLLGISEVDAENGEARKLHTTCMCKTAELIVLCTRMAKG